MRLSELPEIGWDMFFRSGGRGSYFFKTGLSFDAESIPFLVGSFPEILWEDSTWPWEGEPAGKGVEVGKWESRQDCHEWLKRHRKSFLSSKIVAMLEAAESSKQQMV